MLPLAGTLLAATSDFPVTVAPLVSTPLAATSDCSLRVQVATDLSWTMCHWAWVIICRLNEKTTNKIPCGIVGAS